VVAPLVYKYRLEGRVWREILGGRAVVEECFAGAVGALVGAWVGAVPIPLGMFSLFSLSFADFEDLDCLFFEGVG